MVHQFPIKKIIGAVLFGLLGVLSPAESRATTLAPDTGYGVTGTYYVKAATSNGSGYWMVGTINPSSTLNIGSLSGDDFANLVLNSTFTFNVYTLNSNGTTGANIIGTLTGALNASWSNVAYDPAKDVGAGLPGEVSGGGLFFNVNGKINGQNVNFSAPMMMMFASVAMGDANGAYNNVISAFGGQFSMAVGNVGVGYPSSLLAWLAGDTLFGGKSYHLTSDFYGNIQKDCNVPEPASMLLLSAGLLGGGIVRRRKVS